MWGTGALIASVSTLTRGDVCLRTQQAQREAERAEREKQKQTVNMDAQLMLAKEVPVAGASLVAKDAASGASGITASMVAGLRGGESSDSSDSEDD